MEDVKVLIIGVLSCAIFALFVIFVKKNKREKFLMKYFGLSFFKELKQINNRQQILKEFKEVFIEYQCIHGGEIYLMSHSGSGNTNFDPWRRIQELAANDQLIVYAAMTRGAFKEYASKNIDVIKGMMEKKNIHLYLFDNQKPEYYRIGVNTELKKGFWGGFYNEKTYSEDKIEGFSTKNDIFIEAIINMYKGFLESGDKVTPMNITSLLANK